MGKGFFMLIKHNALKKEFINEALLFYNGKTILLKAYSDTGNFLTDPVSKKSVVIISKSKIKEMKQNRNKSLNKYNNKYAK